MLWPSKSAATRDGPTCSPQPAPPVGTAPNLVARYLSSADVVLDLDATNKAQFFAEVASRAERVRRLSRSAVFEALCAREGYGSTALGRGVAIPHARVTGLDQPVAIFVRTRKPIGFDAPDGRPVSEMLVLLVPGHATEHHLEILADAARLFCDRRFREQLADASDAGAVCRLFAAWRSDPFALAVGVPAAGDGHTN